MGPEMFVPVVEMTSYSVALVLNVVQDQVIEVTAMPVTETEGVVAVPAREGPALKREARRMTAEMIRGRGVSVVC